MVTIEKHPDSPKTYRLTAEQRLAAKLDDVFAYFSDARNLQEITPAWLNFSVESPEPMEMCAGARIDYKLRVRGIPIRWQSEITAWEPPNRFVDEQVKGPYKLWRHEHTFVDEGDATLVRDHVDYRVSGGALVHWLLVRRDLVKIFKHRQQVLAGKFGQEVSRRR